MHQTEAAHKAAMGEGHRAAEKCFKAMGKDFAEAASAHGAMADSCEKGAAYHESCTKVLKASIAADLEKLVPDNFRGTIPSDVPGFGIRAIPRPGGPELPTALDKSAIDPRFRHLITTDEA